MTAQNTTTHRVDRAAVSGMPSLFIRVPENTREKAAQNIILPVGGGDAAIDVGKGAEASLVVVVPKGNGAYRITASVAEDGMLSVTTIMDGAGSVSMAHDAAVASRGRLFWNEWTAGGSDVTTRGLIILNGECAEAVVRKAFFATNDERLVGDQTIRHEAPRSTSRIFCNGALDGAANAAFLGRTVIGKGMGGSDADQRQRVVLLSDRARTRIDPVLEIATDDVKCGHGGSVGKLDDMQMFYLTARGIPAAQARALVLEGFFTPFVRAAGEGSTIVLGSLKRRISGMHI